MSKELKKAVNDLPAFDNYYGVLKGYLEFCIKNPKANNKEAEKAEDGAVKKEQIDDKKRDEYKKSFQNAYYNMCDEISSHGISYLTIYVDALKKLSSDNKDLKKEINQIAFFGIMIGIDYCSLKEMRRLARAV